MLVARQLNQFKISNSHIKKAITKIKSEGRLQNIIIGKLSVVGSEISESSIYDNSLHVKPGITGLYRLNSYKFSLTFHFLDRLFYFGAFDHYQMIQESYIEHSTIGRTIYRAI